MHKVTSGWSLTHAQWNKLMHSLHGNTSSGSGGPSLLPAWLHRPGSMGGQVVLGRITGHWRYVAQAAQPAPVFDIWAMSLPGEATPAQPAMPAAAVARPATPAAPIPAMTPPLGGGVDIAADRGRRAEARN